MSDVTKRGEILGMDSTTYLRRLVQHAGVRRAIRDFSCPGGNATLGQLQANVLGEHTNYGVRAREELKLTQSLTAVAGIGWETTTLKGLNSVYKDPVDGRADLLHYFSRPAIPEHRARAGAALSAEYRVAVPRHASPLATERRRSATFLSYPTVRTATTRSSDAEEPRLRSRFRLDAEQCTEVQRDRLLRIFQKRIGHPGGSRQTHRIQASQFNAPRSEHRGVELAADWKFYPGWRFTAAYTYLDQFYTEYTEDIRSGGTPSASTAPATRSPGYRRTN